jgi:hypothetical protein
MASYGIIDFADGTIDLSRLKIRAGDAPDAVGAVGIAVFCER